MATTTKSARKIVISPVTRIEGHGKVTIHLDAKGAVEQARLHVVEFRGFERFVLGRLYWEVPVIIQRLCGICPVSHLLAAAKAMDVIAGVDRIPRTAEKMRRLMHYGQTYQSHALHFFHLASPDLLLGIDSPPATRNVIGLVLKNPELATQGRADAQVGAGDHQGDRGQEDPRQRRDPRRDQQEPHDRRAGLPREGRAADARVGGRGPGALQGAVPQGREEPRGLRQLREQLRQHRAARRVPRPLRRPAAGEGPRREDHLRRREARGLREVPRRRGAQLELHEVPLHPQPRQGEGMVPGRPARTPEQLRPDRHADRGRGAEGVPQAGRQAAGARDHGLPLGAPDRARARGREDRRAAGRSRPAGHRPRGERRAARQHGGLDRGAARHAVPRLRGRPRRPGHPGEPDRLDHEQQRADEPGGGRGRAQPPRREEGDHRGHAQRGRGGHPGLRPVPELRDARGRAACRSS